MSVHQVCTLYQRYSAFNPRHRIPLFEICKFIAQLNRNNVKGYLSKILFEQSILTLFLHLSSILDLKKKEFLIAPIC